MARIKKTTISKKVKRAAKRAGVGIDSRGRLERPVAAQAATPTKTNVELKPVTVPQVVPVRKLAELLGQSVTAIISKLFQNGVQAAINESVDFDTAAIIADEFGYEAIKETETDKKDEQLSAQTGNKSIVRPPVVTVMGHVDHGKTKLLDAIRSTNVVDKESGGITQHIGAYQVRIDVKDGNRKKSRLITFIDTPGHEAFSAMRAHGANVTDIVILVVAADDGVKPQTLEAISHARAAGVPIIVAINKIDRPEADPERVKRQLADHNLLPEDWGGKTPMVAVSAKENKNIDQLLEVVALTADLNELKTDPNAPGKGIVIESKVKPGLGPTATVLVQDGTINASDVFVAGHSAGKIRTMENSIGERIQHATAATPVLISGFKILPQVGEKIAIVSDEKAAQDVISAKQKKAVIRSAVAGGLGREGNVGTKKLHLVLKADTQGSLEAIKTSLGDIASSDSGVGVEFVATGLDNVTESDVNLAATSKATVLAFKVAITPPIKRLADSANVRIARYDIIYEIVDDITAILQSMLEPEIIKTKIGQLKILKVFRRTPENGIVGGKVISGFLRPGAVLKALRNDESLGEGVIDNLKVGPNKIDKIEAGTECGIGYTGNFKFKPNDVIEAYQTEEIMPTLKGSKSEKVVK